MSNGNGTGVSQEIDELMGRLEFLLEIDGIRFAKNRVKMLTQITARIQDLAAWNQRIIKQVLEEIVAEKEQGLHKGKKLNPIAKN